MSNFCRKCGETLASNSVCGKCGHVQVSPDPLRDARQPYKWMYEDTPKPKPETGSARPLAPQIPAPDKPAVQPGLYSDGFMPRYKMWSPFLAAFFSLLLPGAGQFYKGKRGAGIIWLAAVLAAYLIFGWYGAILHLLCVAAAASGDPYKR